MSLLRNFATVGAGTASSRILGFVRDIFIAAALGTGPVADAYFVAQRLPNLFRRLFAEGAFASAFVPLFTKSHEGEGAEAGHRFAEESLAALTALLIVVTIVAELAMVWLTFGLAPGFASDHAKFDLAVMLSRIAFPYLLLISITTLLSGALNGIGRFAAAAFSQSLLNVVLIGALVFLYLKGEVGTVRAGVLLTSAITLGGVVQLAFLLIACRRAGIHLRLVWPRWTENVKRLTRLALPSVVAGGVTQINIVVGTIIASLEAGAVSWLYYADRLYQLPLGIVGIAISVVLLPDLSRALRAGRQDLVDYTQNRSFEFAAALTLPATVALFVIPHQIIAILFQRGAFTAADTAATRPGARRLRSGAARLRRHQGAAAELLRPRGHLDPDVGRGLVDDRQRRRGLRAVLFLRPRRHRQRHLARRLGQHHLPRRHASPRQAPQHGRGAPPPPAAAAAGLGADGRRGLFRRLVAGAVADRPPHRGARPGAGGAGRHRRAVLRGLLPGDARHRLPPRLHGGGPPPFLTLLRRRGGGPIQPALRSRDPET